MSAIARPTFYETQILAASDLEAQLQYSRAALARHERHQHSWGVVHGLELAKSAVGFTIAPGMLVDGTGRQVVVAASFGVNNQEFLNAGMLSQSDAEETWYPVFIAGIDQAQRPSPFRREQCNWQGVSRIDELFDVSFGRPGSELTVMPDPAIDASPGSGAGSQAWQVLVGYVQWDRVGNTIKEAKNQPEAGKQPRYAGVYADTIAARGGAVLMRTRESAQAGKPALLLQDHPDDEYLFQVGKLKPNGQVDPLLKLNANGDLEVTGKLKGTLAAGSVIAESGVVSDGVIVALPSGVSEQMLVDGAAQVCVQLAPRIDAADAPSTAELWTGSVLDCHVDENRQAHCRVRWCRISAAGVVDQVQDRSASFSYLITASVKQD